MTLNLSQNKIKVKSKKAPVGVYSSQVLSVGFHEDYADNSAILVKYKLTDSAGNTFPYEEIFFNSAYNNRSQNFFNYLEENNISLDAIEKFAGCQEKLTIKKVVKQNATHLSIVERKFISHPVGGSSAVAGKK